MVSYILTGIEADGKDILDMLSKYLFVNIDFRNSPADYTQTDNLIELLTVIKDKVGAESFFKRVALVNASEEVKAAIDAALEEVL